MKIAIVCTALLLTGCALMHKPGETQEQWNKDHAECLRDAAPARGIEHDLTYRACMRARGYK